MDFQFLASRAQTRDARIAAWWDALKPDNRLAFVNWVARERGETQFGWDDTLLAMPYRYHAGNDSAAEDIDLAYWLAVERAGA